MLIEPWPLQQVTLVSNLEAYGFVLPALSTACQRAVGAACGVTRAPGARHDQLMLQGDQVRETHRRPLLLLLPCTYFTCTFAFFRLAS